MSDDWDDYADDWNDNEGVITYANYNYETYMLIIPMKRLSLQLILPP